MLLDAVSKLQKLATLARISRKSPAKLADIPDFGRLFAERDLDLHWVVEVAVSFGLCWPAFRRLSSVDAMRGVGSRHVTSGARFLLMTRNGHRHRLICTIAHLLQSFDTAQWTVILGFLDRTMLGDRNGLPSKKGAKPPNPDSSA